MKKFVIQVWELEYYIHIYHFYQREHSQFIVEEIK